MRTFQITELRQDETGKQFEVKTKVQCDSIAALLRHLNRTPAVLWNGCCTIQEDGQHGRRRVTGKKIEKSASLPYGEEDYQQHD